MSVILSNRKWFQGYVWIRNVIIAGAFLGALFHFLTAAPPLWWKPVLGSVYCLFALVIIYELLQKPGLLEVKRGRADSLDIAMYLPNTKTFFYLDDRRIHRFTVQPEDRLELLGELKALPWQQKLQIVVSKPNGQRFQSEVLDVSWAHKSDLKRFYEAAKLFPRR